MIKQSVDVWYYIFGVVVTFNAAYFMGVEKGENRMLKMVKRRIEYCQDLEMLKKHIEYIE